MTMLSGPLQTQDHRIAMSFAVLGTRVAGLIIADKHCVDKTYPSFWDDMHRHLHVQYEPLGKAAPAVTVVASSAVSALSMSSSLPLAASADSSSVATSASIRNAPSHQPVASGPHHAQLSTLFDPHWTWADAPPSSATSVMLSSAVTERSSTPTPAPLTVLPTAGILAEHSIVLIGMRGAGKSSFGRALVCMSMF